MTSEEEKFVRELLQFFYPDQPGPQTISSDLGDLATQMMKEALEGSKAMDYVPRPPGYSSTGTSLVAKSGCTNILAGYWQAKNLRGSP